MRPFFCILVCLLLPLAGQAQVKFRFNPEFSTQDIRLEVGSLVAPNGGAGDAYLLRGFYTTQFWKQLAYRLNRILPRDIAVQRVEAVAPEMHARFSAVSRTYYYYLHTEKNPFLRTTSWETHYQLDFPAMNEAAAWLLTQSDFASFCKVGADVKTTLCQLTRAEWVQLSPTSWRFEITANRFLRNMVRAVVGTLVEVGRHRITLADFQRIVESKRRTAAGESMPAHALFLVDIKY